MNENQLKQLNEELEALDEICEEARHYPDSNEVVLHGYPFPEGWTPETSKLSYDLPETYRLEPPKAYIPDDLRYKGRLPGFVHPCKRDGLNWLCIHEKDLSRFWVPEEHTLITLTRMIDKALKHPNSGYPWKYR